MSRCFPYPRNGASSSSSYEALIESIKLQKETERALKAERKKEKREKKEKKDKKHKHKERNGEKGKSQMDQNELQQDSYMSLQKAAELKEANEKKSRPNTEQLEKSDLSEEHGPSVNPQKPSYSSDSTQNSNKRKRDDSILPDASSGYGKPIKIRLLKKHKGSEAPMEIDQPMPLATKPFNETMVINNKRTNDKPATYGRENSALSGPEMKNDALQGLHFGIKQPAESSSTVYPPSSQLKYRTPNSQINMAELPVLHSSRQQSVSGYGRTVVPSSRVDVDLPGPSSVVPPAPSASRKTDVQGVRLDSNPSDAPDTGKWLANELTAPAPVDGSTRFKKQKDPIIEVPPKLAPTRHEKKIHKKHSKYEKLIGSWVPPLLEALQKPDDEEDWLSRRVKTVKSSSRDNVESCHEVTGSSLWQPCARFLVDADIHALPFTVPF